MFLDGIILQQFIRHPRSQRLENLSHHSILPPALHRLLELPFKLQLRLEIFLTQRANGAIFFCIVSICIYPVFRLWVQLSTKYSGGGRSYCCFPFLIGDQPPNTSCNNTRILSCSKGISRLCLGTLLIVVGRRYVVEKMYNI